MPWKNSSKWWRDADDRSYHPIKNYFNSLPKWDGVPRAEALFIKYLGVEDNAYVQAVTRKWLCAAISRIKEPGCKFDCIPVIRGAQGIGKSMLIARLGMAWFSDSLQLLDIRTVKDATEKLQGAWIIEIGELTGLKRPM